METAPPKILVIIGPTATGKSDLAVEVAKHHNGEVISADSRQVYRGLDIGTGKITVAEMRGVPHHLLDVADPQERFTAKEWKAQAEKAIAGIVARGRLPIICGGTGFYISSLIDGIEFPEVDADPEQQKELEKLPAEELFSLLKNIDPRRAGTIDRHNKRRLSRAIIIARELGAVPPIAAPRKSKYAPGFVGLTLPDSELRERICNRLSRRLDAGMIDEARRLHETGLSYERMEELGLEYRYLARHLQGMLGRKELEDILALRIWQYARRQKTWFRRDKRIHWLRPDEAISQTLTFITKVL